MKMFVSRKLSRNTLDFARNALPASMMIPDNIAHALYIGSQSRRPLHPRCPLWRSWHIPYFWPLRPHPLLRLSSTRNTQAKASSMIGISRAAPTT